MGLSQGRELEAIRAIACTRKTDDMPALCEEMQDIASRATDSNRVAIYLVDRPNNELVMATTPLGYDGDAAHEYKRRPLDGPIMGMVAATRKPAVFSAAMLPDPFKEVALGAGFVEFCIVPLYAEGVLSGTLNLARTYSDPYPQDAVDLAMALGEQISVQIERARLYHREKERVAKLASLNEDLRKSYEELERAQGELIRKEKLASLGELAMLVAHEVRNPLGVVFNVVSQLRKHIPSEASGATLLRILEEEAKRLDRIVKDFLDFGRPTTPQLRPVDLDGLVASAVEVTNRSLASAPSVTWRVTLGGDVATLEADEHLLRGALVNVLLNAVEAQSGQGTVLIKTVRRTVGGHDHVELTVEDEGSIGADVADQVFEPFFTTKAFGTGLGLTIVKRTVEAHGGSVQFGARDGGGTVVTIVLPLSGGAGVQREIRT
jgi:signal transduction histidine kinase